jgi:malate dehydrogenase
MAKAVIEDSGEVMPVCAWVDGEYGISGVYLGVEAEIGRTCIKKVVESNLTESEIAALKVAAVAVERDAATAAAAWIAARMPVSGTPRIALRGSAISA